MGREAGVQEEGALIHWSAGGKRLLLGLERVLHWQVEVAEQRHQGRGARASKGARLLGWCPNCWVVPSKCLDKLCIWSQESYSGFSLRRELEGLLHVKVGGSVSRLRRECWTGTED